MAWTATRTGDSPATLNGDASDLEENQAINGTIIFPAGQNTAQTFTIGTRLDNLVEGDETFEITLAPDTNNPLPTAVEIGSTNKAIGTITDEDRATVSLVATAATVAEGEALGFEIQLTQAADEAIVVRWSVTGGTATPGVDFENGAASRGEVIFNANSTTAQPITLATRADNLVEGNETLTLTIEGDLPDGVSLGVATAIGTITDGDTAEVMLVATTSAVAEGETLGFEVQLSQAVAQAVTVRWSVTGGTATPDTDLENGTATSGEVTFDANSTVGAAAFATSSTAGAAAFTTSSTVGTAASPTNDTTDTAPFAANGTADTEAFATNGTASRSVKLATRTDDLIEGDETLIVTITAEGDLPTGVNIDTDTATGTIIDKISLLIAPRRIGAAAALRRHASRFDSMTSTVIQNRLEGRRTKNATASSNLGDGAFAVGGGFDQSRWGTWIDGAYAGFDGKTTGRQADVYGGVDYLGGDGDWLAGALVGYEFADLDIDQAKYRSKFTHLGFYGGLRLSDRLILDGATTFGTATPEITRGDVSASFDADLFTVRGGLTGDIGFKSGLGNNSVTIAPRIDLLYSRKTLGAFIDSDDKIAGREVLELGRLSAGPRLTWDFDGGQLVGGVRMQWDLVQPDDEIDSRVSGAADIGVRVDLSPSVRLGLHGDVDGLGISDDFMTLGGKG